MRLIRGIQNQHPDNTQRYRLYISQLQDLSVLGVVEAFTEEAPQVRVSGGQQICIKQVGWKVASQLTQSFRGDRVSLLPTFSPKLCGRLVGK